MAFSQIFLPNAFHDFFGFAKEVTPCSRPKILIPRDHLYAHDFTFSFRGMDDKLTLFSSRYLGRNGCQADYEKLKITSKQKTLGCKLRLPLCRHK